MMDKELAQRLKDAVWIRRSLFGRDKTASSSANTNFSHDGRVYIGQSGGCFGTLKEDELEVMNISGGCLSSGKPSKKWSLHLKVYQRKPGTGTISHTHDTYGVLWSFMPTEGETDATPNHISYSKMKLGKTELISYEKPGSQALFDVSGQRMMDSNGYLLKQHGIVVPGKNLTSVFYCLEELEESARII